MKTYRLGKIYAEYQSNIVTFFEGFLNEKGFEGDDKIGFNGNDFILKKDNKIEIIAEIKRHIESINSISCIYDHKREEAKSGRELLPSIQLEKDPFIKSFMVMLNYQFKKNVEKFESNKGWLIQEKGDYIDYKKVVPPAADKLGFSVNNIFENDIFIFFEIVF